MRKYHLFILSFCLFSCVDQLDVATDDALRVLVVEGSISTLPGPHYVYLSRSAQYGDSFVDFSRPESRAFVRIRDEAGGQVVLTEEEDGRYATPRGFRAKVGSSYSIVIETANGEQYASIPETVPQAPIIESLMVQYKRLPAIDDSFFDHGLEVYSVFQDDPSTQNFYLYRNRGTYLVETSPELHVIVPALGGPAIPAPKDCCRTCWVEENDGDNELRVTSDLDFNGNLTSQLAGFIIDDGARFDDKYMIRVYQRSITKEAFQFFNLLNSQLSISGNLFDPPPATLRGNIINIDQPESPVIGYFYASDTAVDSVFLERDLLQDPYLDFEYWDDCRTLERATTKRPSYW